MLIADEIQCGLGRTGTWFSSEVFGLVPDIVVTAKQIAAGLPLAGVTGRAEIMDAPTPGGLGGTRFTDAHRIGATLRDGLTELAERHQRIGDIRGHGAMIAFELTTPGTATPLAGAASVVAEYAARRGVILLTAGSDGNVIRFLPSLGISDDQLRFALDVIDEALAAVP